MHKGVSPLLDYDPVLTRALCPLNLSLHVLQYDIHNPHIILTYF